MAGRGQEVCEPAAALRGKSCGYLGGPKEGEKMNLCRQRAGGRIDAATHKQRAKKQPANVVGGGVCRVLVCARSARIRAPLKKWCVCVWGACVLYVCVVLWEACSEKKCGVMQRRISLNTRHKGGGDLSRTAGRCPDISLSHSLTLSRSLVSLSLVRSALPISARVGRSVSLSLSLSVSLLE
jgi:hypothetical protein